ncbi:Ig-like domain-containing protein [Pseudoalteromonas sp. N1230-9]|uniref:putative Ig domain-containing protein n=1 Tax=Pseudoalteromonas sp. N1230-9 TaxID=2907156 RepID=UPI002B2A47F1|nr:Ig-like domain-containing protein [Pseudoalteromonas sp. N1230-9]
MKRIFKLKPFVIVPAFAFLTACGSSDSNDDKDTSSGNTIPTITSEAVTTATEDENYSYTVLVQDDDSELSFALDTAPTGMTISQTGKIEWLPTEGVLTSGEVIVSVSDNHNDKVTQTFEITVTPVNDAPMVADIEDQIIKNGELFNYQLNVTDPDDTIEGGISFTLLSGPEGMAVSDTGLLSYQANNTETTAYNVNIKINDGGEDNASAATASFNLDAQYFVDVTARIKDYYTEDAISNATASITNGNGILATGTTDGNGEVSFSVQDITITNHMVITSDANGYAEMAALLNETRLSLPTDILLQPIHAQVTFDPTIASNLQVEDAVLVELPANSLVRADNSLVTGPVSAELTIINPAVDVYLMPGEMLTTDENGEIKPIESFGAITVTFEDENGETLNLAENSQAIINIPAVGELASTVPLYYYNEQTGLWVKEGEAQLVNSAEGNFYTGSVSHFTTWNADRIYETVFIHGCLEDNNQNRIAGALVNSQGRDYIGSSSAVTDINGDFSIPVKMDSTVLISSTSGGLSRTFSVETNLTDLTLDECIVLDEVFTKIKLNWGATPSDLDSHLWGPTATEGEQFHIYFGSDTATVNDIIMFLDVDDITSYGPEVISIPEFPLPGTYTYKVHNYSNTPEIDSTTAKVELVINNQRRVFTPPSSGVEDLWHVFDLVVSETGAVEIVEVNKFEDDLILYTSAQNRQFSTQRKAQPYEQMFKKLVSGKYYAK